MPSHSVSLRSILICHLRLGLPRCLFPSCFLTEICMNFSSIYIIINYYCLTLFLWNTNCLLFYRIFFVQNIIAISPTRLSPFTGRQDTRARNHVALWSAGGFANSAEFQKPLTAHFLFCHDHLLQTISVLVASSHSRPSVIGTEMLLLLWCVLIHVLFSSHKIANFVRAEPNCTISLITTKSRLLSGAST